LNSKVILLIILKADEIAIKMKHFSLSLLLDINFYGTFSKIYQICDYQLMIAVLAMGWGGRERRGGKK